MLKKIATAAFALTILTACGTTTGPGNKEDVNDQIEQQNFRGNDMNQPNDNMDNNRLDEFNDGFNNNNNNNNNDLNRRQMNDNNNNDNNDIDNLGPDANDNMNNDKDRTR